MDDVQCVGVDGWYSVCCSWLREVPGRGAGTENEGLFQPREMDGAQICQQEGHGRCECSRYFAYFSVMGSIFGDWGHLDRQRSLSFGLVGWLGQLEHSFFITLQSIRVPIIDRSVRLLPMRNKC